MKIIYSFDGTVGELPRYVTLGQGQDGQLYGTATYGGANNFGSVFKINTSGKATLLHSFTLADGTSPNGGLTLAGDGNLYGTVGAGSVYTGAIYKITPSGEYVTVRGLSVTEGSYPSSPPIYSSDGSLYGTAYEGGNSRLGTVYKIRDGGPSVIYQYDYTHGQHPISSPLQGLDGKLYVTSESGGAHFNGTALQLSTEGALENTYSFDLATTGVDPEPSLVWGSDGNLYGTTGGGGADSDGVLYKLSTNFDYTALHTFGTIASDGKYPAGVVQAADGNFYGMTQAGGTFGGGTIYSYALSGSYQTLYNWNAHNVLLLLYEQGALVQHTNGKFYGVTYGAAPRCSAQFLASMSG